MRHPQNIYRQRAFADLVGVPYGTIKRWVHDGMPTLRQGRNVTIDAAAARAWIEANKKDSVAFSRASVLYFAQPEGEERIKIGWTNDVTRRMRELRKATGKTMLVLATVPANHATELAVHDMFAEVSLGAEWFRSTPALLKLIDALLALPLAKARTHAERAAEGEDRSSAA